MNLETILDDCLFRLQQDEAIGACLERYPQQAAELKPMLVAAAQLRSLSAHQLSAGQRLKGQQALRRAWAAHHARIRPAPPAGWFAWLRAPVALGLAALLLFVAAAASTVAASRPGDPAYPARVTIERAATWPLRGGGRAAAELTIAERRLADVQHTGRADPIALGALVSGDEAAALLAEALPAVERAAVAERIETHATGLAVLADAAADDAARQRLATAAAQLQRLADRLRIRLERERGPEELNPIAPSSGHGAPATPRPTRQARPTTAEHTPRADMPSPGPAATPEGMPTRRSAGSTPGPTTVPPAATTEERPTSPATTAVGPASPAATMTATRQTDRTPEPSRRATAGPPTPLPDTPPAGPTRRPDMTAIVATPPSAPPSQPPGSGEPPTSPPAPPPQPTRQRRP